MWRVTLRIALGFEYVIEIPGDTPEALTREVALPVMLGAVDEGSPRLVALLFEVSEIDNDAMTAVALLSGWEERSPARRTRVPRRKGSKKR